MKKIILFSILAFATSAQAQNVKDQKVSFTYIQLPITPLNKTISTYNVGLDATSIEKNNQDSLDAQDVKLMVWQASYDTWLESKKKIDKAYLLELAKHEKAINAGGNMALPTKPPYPEPPKRIDAKELLLTDNVNVNALNVKLEGYTKGDGGANIIIEPLGFQMATIIEKKSGSGTTTKYVYSSRCKYPIHVKVTTPSDGVIVDKIIGDSLITKVLKQKYTSKYDYQYWAIDNLNAYWKTRQAELLSENLKRVNTLVNDKCGYPLRTRKTEIYTVKKYKSHNYSDLVDAYTNVNSGYSLIKKDRNHASAKAKIMKGIKIWENAFAESNLSDNKSRINKKITALLLVNLAEAYMWIDDFDTAENYRLKAEQAGVLKYKMVSKRLEKFMINAKQRYQINN